MAGLPGKAYFCIGTWERRTGGVKCGVSRWQTVEKPVEDPWKIDGKPSKNLENLENLESPAKDPISGVKSPEGRNIFRNACFRSPESGCGRG